MSRPDEGASDAALDRGLYAEFNRDPHAATVYRGYHDYRHWRLKDLEREVKPDACDWRAIPEWRTNELSSDTRRVVRDSWGLGVMLSVASLPILWFLPRELQTGNVLALFGLVFALVAVVLFTRSVRKAREQRHYGDTLLSLEPFPACVGGQVEGVARWNNHALVDVSVSTTLECVYTYYMNPKERDFPMEDIRWSSTTHVRATRSGKGASLGFVFEIPAALPATEAETHEAIDRYFWRIKMRAQDASEALACSFLIPVVSETAASSTDEANATPA